MLFRAVMMYISRPGEGGWLPVLSGMVACSLFLSLSNLMLPSWSTVDTTFNIPAEWKRSENPDLLTAQ